MSTWTLYSADLILLVKGQDHSGFTVMRFTWPLPVNTIYEESFDKKYVLIRFKLNLKSIGVDDEVIRFW